MEDPTGKDPAGCISEMFLKIARKHTWSSKGVTEESKFAVLLLDLYSRRCKSSSIEDYLYFLRDAARNAVMRQ